MTFIKNLCVCVHYLFISISNAIRAKGLNFFKIVDLTGEQIMRVLWPKLIKIN